MGVSHESFSPEGVLAGASTNSIMRFRVPACMPEAILVRIQIRAGYMRFRVPACMPEAILVRIQISAGYQDVQQDGARFEVWSHVRASDFILFRL